MGARSLMVIAIRILALLCLAGAAARRPIDATSTHGDRQPFDVRLISAASSGSASGKLTRATPTATADHAARRPLCLAACAAARARPQNVAPTAKPSGPERTGGATVNLNGALSTDADGPQPLTYAWQFILRPAGSTRALANRPPSTDVRRRRPGRYALDSRPRRTRDSRRDPSSSRHELAPVATPARTRARSSATVTSTVPARPTWTATAHLYSGRSSQTPRQRARSLPARRGPRAPVSCRRGRHYAIQLVAFDGSSPQHAGRRADHHRQHGAGGACARVAPRCRTPIAACRSARWSPLDGSASTDVDGDPLTYAWTLVGRPPGAARCRRRRRRSHHVRDGRARRVRRAADRQRRNVRQRAEDAQRDEHQRQADRGRRGQSRSASRALPRLVQPDGSGSVDPEGQGLTYAWSLLAKPRGQRRDAVERHGGHADVHRRRAGNVHGATDRQRRFSVEQSGHRQRVNGQPAADRERGPDQAVVAGATAQLTSAGSSDSEGQPLGYFWSMLAKPPGSAADFNNANAANPTFVADRKGTFVAQLIVNDGVLDSAPDTVQVTATNRAPVAVADSYSMAEDGSLVMGVAAGVLANDTDADGDTLTAILVGATPAGLVLNGNGGFAYTPPANFNGTTTFQYKANDGTVDSNTVTVTITVTAVNDPPVANAGPNQNLPTPGLVQLNGSASSDPDGQTLTYAWTLTGKPAGSAAALSNAAIVNPTFTADLGGTYVADLIVSDGALSSAPATVTITVDALPTVSIVATDANASETGPDPGVFTITRTGPTTLSVNVFYSIGGTSSNGSDYAAISGVATIAAGQASTTVTITPVIDAGVEGVETVMLTIAASPTTYLIGARAAPR